MLDYMSQSYPYLPNKNKTLAQTFPCPFMRMLINSEESNTPRSDLFFTSKLKTNRGYDETLRDLRNSLKVAGLEYFDLYLMHSAIGGPQMRKDVWRACVDAQKEGLVKSIGVSTDPFPHPIPLSGTVTAWGVDPSEIR